MPHLPRRRTAQRQRGPARAVGPARARAPGVPNRSAPAAPPAILESILDATLRTLMEHSTDFIALAALDGRVLLVNPAGQHLVGLPAPAGRRHSAPRLRGSRSA